MNVVNKEIGLLLINGINQIRHESRVKEKERNVKINKSFVELGLRNFFGKELTIIERNAKEKVSNHNNYGRQQSLELDKDKVQIILVIFLCTL